MVAVPATRGWAYFDPEYEFLSASLNPPRVVIDNATFPDATVIKLDSINRHGILLDVVEVLTDLELFISKAYVSSDGGWFMDVFHVIDEKGNKITDETLLKFIEESLEEKAELPQSRSISTKHSKLTKSELASVSLGAVGSEHTAIEFTGQDRPGLLSEVTSALADLNCNIASAQLWTHNFRVACLIFVENSITGGPIEDSEKLSAIREQLCRILADKGDIRGGKTGFFQGLTHTERRLHQIMSADDEHTCNTSESLSEEKNTVVTVRNCVERGYSVVNIRCKNRSKLLFDTVCTLTDMDYMIFHATVLSEGSSAYQEFYIRHTDGCTLETEAERQRLIKRLVAAIERRFSRGVRLELCTYDRVGLLSEMTKVFHRHGLSVTRAYVSTTRCGRVSNTFYVTDSSGSTRVSKQTVEQIREEIGQTIMLQVKDVPTLPKFEENTSKFSLASFFRAHSGRLLYSLGFMRDCPSENLLPRAAAKAL